MKKSLVTKLAMICVLVFAITTVATPGMYAAEGLMGIVNTSEKVTQLASTVVSKSDAPAYDDPLPKNYEKWDGTVATGFKRGSGVNGDPFIISTPEEFAFFMAKVKDLSEAPKPTPTSKPVYYYSAYYKLANDIVFNDDFAVNGTSIDNSVEAGLKSLSAASYTTDFKGVFDGDGHKIYNLYIVHEGKSGSACSGTGLFGQVYGTIKNLHLVRGYMYGIGDVNRSCGGTFARVLFGPGKITGCSSGMTFVMAGTGAGGMVGILEHKSKLAEISNCTFTGEVHSIANSSSNRAGEGTGGILGVFRGDDDNNKEFTITDCINRGKVLSSGKYIGGIIGRISGDYQNQPHKFTIARCINFGTVASTYIIPSDESSPGSGIIGGIVGGAGDMKNVSTYYHMEHCANLGTVQGQENAIGGLIGSVSAQGGAITNPLRFYSCYSIGTVKAEAYNGSTNKFGGKAVGGFVGTPNCPVEVYDGIIGGVIKGNDATGGVVGKLASDSWSSAMQSTIKLVSTHINAEVNGKTSVGGVVGQFLCGSTRANSSFTMKACFVEGSVVGEKLVGGLIGELSKGKSTNVADVILHYSVTDVYIEKTESIGGAGILIGGTSTSALPRLEEVEFYAADEVYDSSSGEAKKFADALPMYNHINPDFQLSKIFVRDNLTNNSYLLRIITGAAMADASSSWVADAVTKRPVHKTYDQMRNCEIGHSYDGTPANLVHRDWLGIAPVCSWQEWDGSAWVPLSKAPVDVGQYRVMAVLFAGRISAAAIAEFEITKQEVNFAKIKWPEKTILEYNGEEQVMELLDVPEGIDIVYTGSRYTDAGASYISHVESISDASGNFELLNMDKITDKAWSINAAKISYSDIIWSDVDPVTGKPTLTYTGELQRIKLIEKVEEGETARDLDKLLSITYTGHEQTNAGENYRAIAKFNYDNKNVSFAGAQDDKSTSWDIKKRVIDPLNNAIYNTSNENVTATPVTGEKEGDKVGIKVTYDAREHGLVYAENLPALTASYTSANYVRAGEYAYDITFTLTDSANNEIAGTKATTVTCKRYLIIEKATPTIYGAENVDTTFVLFDPEQKAKDDLTGQPLHQKDPQYFAIGVEYEQDKSIKLDEDGNEIFRLSVDMSGIAELREELASISTEECFTIRYFMVKNGYGEALPEKEPVTNYNGDEKVDGRWARPYHAGTYEAVVTYDAPPFSNFNDVSITAELIINPYKYKLPLNVVMRDTEVAENGDVQMLELEYAETLPSFITLNYTCNGTKEFPTTVGKYLFRVDFTFSEDMKYDYHPLQSLQAYLKIYTDTLYDNATQVKIHFLGGTYYRLLVKERTDVNRFVTDWQVGYNTALQSLYQIELKDGHSNVWAVNEGTTLSLPLSKEIAKAGRDNIIPVLISIDDKGKYEITRISEDKYNFGVVKPGELPKYINISVNRIGYYGVVTPSDRGTGAKLTWMIFAACMIPPSVAVIVATTLVGMRAKKKKDDN